MTIQSRRDIEEVYATDFAEWDKNVELATTNLEKITRKGVGFEVAISCLPPQDAIDLNLFALLTASSSGSLISYYLSEYGFMSEVFVTHLRLFGISEVLPDILNEISCMFPTSRPSVHLATRERQALSIINSQIADPLTGLDRIDELTNAFYNTERNIFKKCIDFRVAQSKIIHE